MTFVAPESAQSLPTTRIPSIAILGADALLAALPATPVQLAHACMLAGYQSVVPASWGDELIAAASLRALEKFGTLPAIQCSCPLVAHRLLAAGADLRPFLLSLVAPPVAIARYLRSAHAPAKLRLTFVGRCPGAADESIDARLTPEELLAIFADRGITLEDQPRVFDSVLPPDRRRHRSQPGGLPTPEMLWSVGGSANGGRRSLVELHGEELPVELAQHLLAGKPVLIDVAGKLGCLCSGATPGADARKIRSSVTALEPPRAPSPVIDERVPVELELPLPASARSAIDLVAPTGLAVRGTPGETTPHGVDLPRSNGDPHGSQEDRPAAVLRSSPADSTAPMPPAPTRRHSPPRGVARAMGGGLPTARDANGRQLPRTYVARRRSPSRSNRAVSPDSTPAPMESSDSQSTPAPRDAAEPDAVREPATKSEPLQTATTSAATAHVNVGASEPRGDAPSMNARDAGSLQQSANEAPTPIPASTIRAPGGAAAATFGAVERTDPFVRPPSAPASRTEEDDSRYGERAVQLPVTPRSDATRRDSTPAVQRPATERPFAQLLVFALLISTIVLVSAAVGVVVGRWMAQR